MLLLLSLFLSSLVVLLLLSSLFPWWWCYFTETYCSFQAKRNLSQLPNFALSIPLALFYCSKNAESAQSKQAPGSDGKALAESNAKLQEALIMFPNVLLPLMDKCQVTLDPAVMKHGFFTAWTLEK